MITQSTVELEAHAGCEAGPCPLPPPNAMWSCCVSSMERESKPWGSPHPQAHCHPQPQKHEPVPTTKRKTGRVKPKANKEEEAAHPPTYVLCQPCMGYAWGEHVLCMTYAWCVHELRMTSSSVPAASAPPASTGITSSIGFTWLGVCMGVEGQSWGVVRCKE